MTNNSTNNNIILIIINVCSNIFGSRFELVSGVPHRPPGQLLPLPRTFLLRMDVAAEVDPSESLFAQRAEELFEQISNENAVSSESASLVVALAYLDLEVTEEQVVEATRGILKPPEIQFSKDVFFKFVELLRRQTSVTGYVTLPECAENVSAAPAIPTHALCSDSEVRAHVAASVPAA